MINFKVILIGCTETSLLFEVDNENLIPGKQLHFEFRNNQSRKKIENVCLAEKGANLSNNRTSIQVEYWLIE